LGENTELFLITDFPASGNLLAGDEGKLLSIFHELRYRMRLPGFREGTGTLAGNKVYYAIDHIPA
jgi:hypothetical protein